MGYMREELERNKLSVNSTYIKKDEAGRSSLPKKIHHFKLYHILVRSRCIYIFIWNMHAVHHIGYLLGYSGKYRTPMPINTLHCSLDVIFQLEYTSIWTVSTPSTNLSQVNFVSNIPSIVNYKIFFCRAKSILCLIKIMDRITNIYNIK